MRTPEANERLFNSPSEGEVYIVVKDGKIESARYRDENAEGEPKVSKLSSEFKQNDGANDPVGTAPPAAPTPVDTTTGATTAVAGHEVQGFPNEAAPAKPITPEQAEEIAIDQGVPEAVEQANDAVPISNADQVGKKKR